MVLQFSAWWHSFSFNLDIFLFLTSEIRQKRLFLNERLCYHIITLNEWWVLRATLWLIIMSPWNLQQEMLNMSLITTSCVRLLCFFIQFGSEKQMTLWLFIFRYPLSLWDVTKNEVVIYLCMEICKKKYCIHCRQGQCRDLLNYLIVRRWLNNQKVYITNFLWCNLQWYTHERQDLLQLIDRPVSCCLIQWCLQIPGDESKCSWKYNLNNGTLVLLETTWESL